MMLLSWLFFRMIATYKFTLYCNAAYLDNYKHAGRQYSFDAQFLSKYSLTTKRCNHSLSFTFS